MDKRSKKQAYRAAQRAREMQRAMFWESRWEAVRTHGGSIQAPEAR
jgi:hypothetical protein